MSDQELNERLRNTALYAALQAVAHKKARPEGFKLSPAETLEAPEQAEIALRWPSLSPEEVIAIERDYQRDCSIVHGLDLDGIYQSMEQLVENDISMHDHT